MGSPGLASAGGRSWDVERPLGWTRGRDRQGPRGLGAAVLQGGGARQGPGPSWSWPDPRRSVPSRQRARSPRRRSCSELGPAGAWLDSCSLLPTRNTRGFPNSEQGRPGRGRWAGARVQRCPRGLQPLTQAGGPCPLALGLGLAVLLAGFWLAVAPILLAAPRGQPPCLETLPRSGPGQETPWGSSSSRAPLAPPAWLSAGNTLGPGWSQALSPAQCGDRGPARLLHPGPGRA